MCWSLFLWYRTCGHKWAKSYVHCREKSQAEAEHRKEWPDSRNYLKPCIKAPGIELRKVYSFHWGVYPDCQSKRRREERDRERAKRKAKEEEKSRNARAAATAASAADTVYTVAFMSHCRLTPYVAASAIEETLT